MRVVLSIDSCNATYQKLEYLSPKEQNGFIASLAILFCGGRKAYMCIIVNAPVCFSLNS